MDFKHILITKYQTDPKKTDQFLEYHKQNINIWKEFEKITLELASKGRRGYSAMQILGIIRYHSDIKGNDEFKVNNNYAPFYSRVFAIKHPQYQSFFEFRELNNKGAHGN